MAFTTWLRFALQKVYLLRTYGFIASGLPLSSSTVRNNFLLFRSLQTVCYSTDCGGIWAADLQSESKCLFRCKRSSHYLSTSLLVTWHCSMLMTAWGRCDFHFCDKPVVYLLLENVMTDRECIQLDNPCPPQHLLVLVDAVLSQLTVCQQLIIG